MNNKRRNIIDKALNHISSACADLEGVRDEEQEDLDNMSETQQEGDKGEKVQAVIEALEEALTDLGNAENLLVTAKE